MEERKVLAYRLLSAAIDLAVLVLEEDEQESVQRCLHPEGSRLNVTTMGGPERWYCRECGFEYIEDG